MQLASGEFERELNTILKNTFGSRYLKYYKEKEVAKREELDRHLNILFRENKGFILSGGVGVGKTMALIYIYTRIIKYLSKEAREKQDAYLYQLNRYSGEIQFFFAPELFSKLHTGGKIRISQYILIDDLGREYSEPFALERFECLIEDIYRNKNVSLVITTNLNLSQFKNRNGWLRIVDRLREICSWVDIEGKSRRHV
ncbi:MAG: hypothetical protein U9Q18_02470 [Caldisericota bacterium]|nr:hypothetical protein [Caldisericota bacterium]